MNHTTKCVANRRRHRKTRELPVLRRSLPPAPALRVEVRREMLPAAEEEGLVRAAALQRLGQLRRRIDALRTVHLQAASNSIETVS